MQEVAELEPGRSASEENICSIEVEKPRQVPASRVVLSFVFSLIPSGKCERRLGDVIHIVIYSREEFRNHLVPGPGRENIGNPTVGQLVPKAIVDRIGGERLLLFAPSRWMRVSFAVLTEGACPCSSEYVNQPSIRKNGRMAGFLDIRP